MQKYQTKAPFFTMTGKPLLNGNNDGLSFEGNSFCAWLLFLRSDFEVVFVWFFFSPSRAIFYFKTVTLFLALLPDQCLKLYWFSC